MASTRDRPLRAAALVRQGFGSELPHGAATDARPVQPPLEIEIDGHVYMLVPEWLDRSDERDERFQNVPHRAAPRVGELVTPRGRYVIVPADAADAEEEGPARRTHGLSKRELQIVVLVAEGCVNKQIADHLKISEWTVSTHLRRIFAKLAVDSRAAMVYRCLSMIGRKNQA